MLAASPRGDTVQQQQDVLAVVGSGLMGRGIAYVAAVGGFETRLLDVSAEALERALRQIRSDLDDAVRRGRLTAADAAIAMGRIRPVSAFETAVAGASFVIEAVPEDPVLKQALFGRLDALCGPEVVLASNTSGLFISAIAAQAKRSDRVIGMHFFNPVPRMRLVEIVRGPQTSDAALARTCEVSKRMGKETVVCRESPGFLTSRVNALIGNEAFLMLEAGIASAGDIDKALKLGLNHPMGPFEMVDLVGLDTRLAVLENLHRTLGEKYRPAPLLVRYVKEGRLGRKSGRGVYDYEETM
jgi:3-hydroxybutyryl-CoA dehydrogenase